MIYALSLLALALPSFAAPSITVSLSGDAVVTDVDNLKVTSTIKNTGDEVLTLLNDPRTLYQAEWVTRAFDIKSAAGVVPLFEGIRVSHRV